MIAAFTRWAAQPSNMFRTDIAAGGSPEAAV
jgi:hypothetical protein